MASHLAAADANVMAAHMLGHLSLKELCLVRVALVTGALYDEVNAAIRRNLADVYRRSVDAWAARIVDVLTGVFDNMLASLVSGTWPVRHWSYMLTFGEHKVFFDASEKGPLCTSQPAIFCAVYKDVERFNSFWWVDREHPEDVIGTFLIEQAGVGPTTADQWAAMAHLCVRQALWAQLGGDAAMAAAATALAPLAACPDIRGLIDAYRNMVQVPFQLQLDLGSQYLVADGAKGGEGGWFVYTYKINNGVEHELYDPETYKKVSCRKKHQKQWMTDRVMPDIRNAVKVAQDLVRPFQLPIVC